MDAAAEAAVDAAAEQLMEMLGPDDEDEDDEGHEGGSGRGFGGGGGLGRRAALLPAALR
jgi:hypothetical protein